MSIQSRKQEHLWCCSPLKPGRASHHSESVFDGAVLSLNEMVSSIEEGLVLTLVLNPPFSAKVKCSIVFICLYLTWPQITEVQFLRLFPARALISG